VTAYASIRPVLIAGKTHVEGMGRCSECGEYTAGAGGAAVI
jgi:hypothetical protein